MNLGTNIADIAIPEGTVKSIRRGDDKLWQNGGLPTAFQRCAYIAGTGTQYIDTGVLLDSASSVYVDFIKNTAVAAQQTVFGYEAARSERFMVRVNNGETYYFDTTSGSKKANGAVLGENEVSANLADRTITVNGTETQMSSIGFSNTLSTFLFATNGNSAPAAFGEFQLCAATFFSGAVLSRDFIPCYLTAEWNGISAGTIGLYDLAGSICPLTNTPFYINAGTGAFLKGADIA